MPIPASEMPPVASGLQSRTRSTGSTGRAASCHAAHSFRARADCLTTGMSQTEPGWFLVSLQMMAV